ncbi:MAG: aldehyde dehydrogenase family protein, partial [Hyphomicrobium sp.]
MMTTSTPSLIKSHAFIGGAWVGMPATPVIDKATGVEIVRVPDFGARETRQAIEAAHAALMPWSKLTAKDRSAI